MSKIINKLKNIQMTLNLKYDARTNLRTSHGGVPHLLVKDDWDGDLELSIVYFGKTKTFKLFYPYKNRFQTRENFEHSTEIIDRCVELLKLKEIK